MKYSTADAIFCDSVTVATYEPKDFDHTLRLFPNPSAGLVTLELPLSETPAMIRVFDPLGRELGKLTVTETASQIDLSRWRDHKIFFLKIQGASGQLAGRILRME